MGIKFFTLWRHILSFIWHVWHDAGLLCPASRISFCGIIGSVHPQLMYNIIIVGGYPSVGKNGTFGSLFFVSAFSVILCYLLLHLRD